MLGENGLVNAQAKDLRLPSLGLSVPSPKVGGGGEGVSEVADFNASACFALTGVVISINQNSTDSFRVIPSTMSSRLALYISFCISVGLSLGFHLLLARKVVRLIAPSTPASKTFLVGGIALFILFLDFPIAHTMLVYKLWNPHFLDQFMQSFATPLVLLHCNVAVMGGGWMLHGWWKRWRVQRSRTRKGTDISLSEVAPPASAPPSAPALAGVPRLGAIHPASRRRFLQTAALATGGVIANNTMLKALGTTHEHKVEQVVMKIPGLPAPFKGTTIALLTDIHSSVFMTREQMEKYAAETMKLKPDLIFVTGDFVNSKVGEVYPFAEAFAGLRAPLGVFGVTGNHDYYTGDIKTVAEEVGQGGIRLLRNENLAIERGGAKLWLMGMDDDRIYDINGYLKEGKTETGTLENLTRGIPENGTKLFLCHKPYPFEEYSQLGVHAMFSGHTHGGQVVLAHLDSVNVSFASLASKYVAGLYRARSNRTSQLYVSRGIGTVGIPMRLNCPPEITRIVLV